MELLQGQVTVIRNDRTAHVLLSGEFDVQEAEELARELQPLIEEPPQIVVINLGQVTFMCSSTLAALISLRNACDGAEQEFVITDRSEYAQRLLELSALGDFLGLCPIDWRPVSPATTRV